MAAMSRPADTFTVKLVGMTFLDGYPQNLHLLHKAGTLRGQGVEGLPLVLIRNPDNPVDSNAIQVHSPTIDQMLGHLPAFLAAKLAPCLDDGETWLAEVDTVLIDPDHTTKPGLLVRVTHITHDSEMV
jgi:hypothetical protein